jgi:Ala-tRNA(Pro) deacylase
MRLTDALNNASARYELRHHTSAFTAQKIAQEEHVPGMMVAKPVVIIADGVTYMCVLPASRKIDFAPLRSLLSAEHVELVHEEQLKKLFPDCELGAQPPFGSFYGMPTIVDSSLENDDFIIFQSGTHKDAVKMSMADYVRIEQPHVYSFSTPM